MNYDLVCKRCGCTFKRKSKDVASARIKNISSSFCSRECRDLHQRTRREVSCTQCGATVVKFPNQIGNNNFCDRSCAASYNNRHKRHGCRRSKLEAYIESCLRRDFPDLEIICNGTDAIGYELDIYIPALKFAIELNGIFHYEPIYGLDKLSRVLFNDKQKLLLCYERGIELCVLDISKCKHFTTKAGDFYYEVLRNIVSSICARANEEAPRIELGPAE